MIAAAPDAWFHGHTSRSPKPASVFHPDALADYLHYARQPDTTRSMCEDYRAAATIDLVHDRESRAAGKKVQCPMLVLWGSNGKIGEWYEPLPLWQSYCANTVVGGAVKAGHYIAEEAPEATLEWFGKFF